MSVTITAVREVLTGAALGSWVPAFQMMESDDVVVYLINTGVTPNTATLLVKDVDYSVTLNTPSDLPSLFTLQLINATTFPGLVLGANRQLNVSRLTSLTQDRTFAQGDAFPEDAVELALDKVVLSSQDSADQYKRALRANDADASTIDLELPLASERAGKFLGFDSTGNVISTSGTLTGVTATAFWSALISTANNEEASLEGLGFLFDTTANILLATGDFTGALAVSTDNNLIYVWDGAAWARIQRFDSGTIGARPAFAAFGIGVYYATDTHRFSFSDGSSWVDAGIQETTNAALPGTPAAKEIYIDTDRNQLLLGDGATAGGKIIRSAERGYINGLIMTWQTVTTMQVGVGAARDSTDVLTGRRTSALSKTLSAGAWAEGAAGSMIEGAVPGTLTWHHVFLLMKPDGTTDWGIDTSTTAATLLGVTAGATVAGYTLYRRIGSVLVNSGSQLQRFIQVGNEFTWHDQATVDIDEGSNPGGNADTTPTTETLNMCPTGYKFMVHLNVYTARGGAHYGRIYDPDTADRAIATNGTPSIANCGGSSPGNATQVSVLTNTSAQVRHVFDSTPTEFVAAVYGWTDNREENWS